MHGHELHPAQPVAAHEAGKLFQVFIRVIEGRDQRHAYGHVLSCLCHVPDVGQDDLVPPACAPLVHRAVHMLDIHIELIDIGQDLPIVLP